jgi:hypothetical protein
VVKITPKAIAKQPKVKAYFSEKERFLESVTVTPTEADHKENLMIKIFQVPTDKQKHPSPQSLSNPQLRDMVQAQVNCSKLMANGNMKMFEEYVISKESLVRDIKNLFC